MSPGVLLLQAKISVSYLGQDLGGIYSHTNSHLPAIHARLTHTHDDPSTAGVEIKDWWRALVQGYGRGRTRILRRQQLTPEIDNFILD